MTNDPLTTIADLIAPKAIGADEETVRALVARQAGVLTADQQEAIVADVLSRPTTYPEA